MTKSLRQLLLKGGQGGLIKEGLTTEWDYFPSEKMTTGNRLKVHTLAEREKRNKTAFISVRCEIKDDELEIENEIATKVTENTYRLISVKKIETLINEKLHCS